MKFISILNAFFTRTVPRRISFRAGRANSLLRGGILLGLFSLTLGAGVLRGETQWSLYDDFKGKVAKHWPYGHGDGEVTAENGRLKVDAEEDNAVRRSIDIFAHRSVRFKDFREISGRGWSIGLATGDDKSTVLLHRDLPDSPDLFFTVGKDGKTIIKEDLGPLPADSSLDLSLEWAGDQLNAEVKRNGKSIMEKAIPASDVARDVQLFLIAYNATVFSLGGIDAGPEVPAEMPKRPIHGKMGTTEIDMGYVPSPWEKSKVSPALAELCKLRPVDLPRHPLAGWVADRLARDTGKTPDPGRIEAALKAFRQQNGFWVRNDESGFWLSNGQVGYALLPADQGSAIASIYNLETGTECIFKPPQPSTPWVLRFIKKYPKDMRPAPLKSLYPDVGRDLSYLKETDGSPVNTEWKMAITDQSAKLSLVWAPVEAAKGADQFAVDGTIVMDKNSPLIRWRANARRVNGSAYMLRGLRFPMIRSLSAPEQSDLTMAWGQPRGDMYRAFKSWGNSYFAYPHHGWTLPFASISYGPDSTLYLAAEDGEANFKQGVFDPKGSTYFEHAAWDPDQFEMTYDVVTGPIKGDWYDAARLYRQWAIQQKWCAKGTLWERAQKGTVDKDAVEVDYWVRPNWADSSDRISGSMIWWPEWLKDEDAPRNGAEELWANVDWFWHGKLPRFTRNADHEKITPTEPPQRPRLGVWWYGWENQLFDAMNPVFTPQPGAEEEFKKEVRAGLVITPYIDVQCWDVEEPSYTPAARAATTKYMDGKPYIGNYNATLAVICSSGNVISDATAGIVANLRKWGANGVYLDTLPSAGYCWDTSHGHTPGPAGHWDVDNQRRYLERIKAVAGEQFAVTLEHKTEPLMDCVDVVLSYGSPEPEEAPLWPAIYGGYCVVSGASVHPKGPDDLVAFRLKLGRVFLWGGQLGRGVFSGPLLEKDKALFLRKLVWLRAQAHKFMPYGEMLRPPAFSGDIPRVKTDAWIVDQARFKLEYNAYEAALWKAPDGDLGLALVNFDDKPHTVTFPANQVFAEGDRTASLLNAEGEKPFRAVNASENVTLELPPADAVMVVFKK